MKAELDDHGKLSVIAETPLESFALGVWWDGYTETVRPTQPPVLHVKTLKEKPGDETTTKCRFTHYDECDSYHDYEG